MYFVVFCLNNCICEEIFLKKYLIECKRGWLFGRKFPIACLLNVIRGELLSMMKAKVVCFMTRVPNIMTGLLV